MKATKRKRGRKICVYFLDVVSLALQKMFTHSAGIASLYFDDWYSWAIRSQLEPMIKLAQSLQKHRDGI
ncbi:transposase, partial [Mesobacillus sp.]|uniref:transposase n=1 Tax=Mesobacillus sp. TaxID=2675271 RepID=UPI0039EE6CCF